MKLGILYDAKEDYFYNFIDETGKNLTEDLQAALDAGEDLVMCPELCYLFSLLLLLSRNQVK